MKTVIYFFRDEAAATSIEYALIAAGIAVAIVTVVTGLGSNLGVKYTSVKTSLD